MEAEIYKVLAGLLLVFIGAYLKSVFDKVAVERGWVREEKKAVNGEIQRVDSHARSELTRIERDLGAKIGDIASQVSVLKERVDSLPTSDDFQALDRRIGDLGISLGRDLSGVVSKVDGMNVTVKTILDHILPGGTLLKTMIADRLREARRLIVLQLLAAIEGRKVDAGTLGLALRDMGHGAESTVLESELRWLERQGLVQLIPTAAKPVVALTEKGDLAQRGDIEEPGVARPALP